MSRHRSTDAFDSPEAVARRNAATLAFHAKIAAAYDATGQPKKAADYRDAFRRTNGYDLPTATVRVSR